MTRTIHLHLTVNLNTLLSLGWNPKRNARWEKIRARGKRRFVFVNGMLVWGASMFMWMSAFQYWSRPDFFGAANIVTNLVAYPIAGILWGIFVWNASERNYRKYMEERQTRADG